MSTTLGPIVPSLMGSSICLLLTVSVPVPALMDTSNATGDPIRDDSRRKSPEKGICGSKLARPRWGSILLVGLHPFHTCLGGAWANRARSRGSDRPRATKYSLCSRTSRDVPSHSFQNAQHAHIRVQDVDGACTKPPARRPGCG